MFNRLLKTALFLLIIVYLLWFVRSGSVTAQDPPPEPLTVFNGYCQLSEPEGVTILWGYEATGGDRWIGSGYDFVTLPGSHPAALTAFMPTENPTVPTIGLGRLVEYPDPAMSAFNGIAESVFVTFDLGSLPECGKPQPLPAPTATPNGSESCPAEAINSATGLPYCYQPQPGGLIPLPPAMGG